MKSLIVSVIALLSVMIVPFTAQAQATAIGNNTTSFRRQSFNTGWTFIMIPNAKLWNDGSPNLYSCRVTLKQNGTMKDQTTEKFGIRKIEWSNKGLFVNGQKTLLRGGCIHHDSGILGAATYDESEWRRVRILKEYGFNAIRSAHNPISRAMMEAC